MKEYPLKEYRLKNTAEKPTNICECGHTDYFHDIKREDCNLCECPEYKFERELTLSEAIKLQMAIRRKNIKLGFTT